MPNGLAYDEVKRNNDRRGDCGNEVIVLCTESSGLIEYEQIKRRGFHKDLD